MQGMRRQTGVALSGDEHIWQSVTDILMTPIGTRVMRRAYGSDLMNIIDKPSLENHIAEIYMATVEALTKWEPRIKVSEVQLLSVSEEGKVIIGLSLIIKAENRLISGEVFL